MRLRQPAILGCFILFVVTALWGPPRLIDTAVAVTQEGGIEQLIDQLQDNWPWTLAAILVLMVLEAFLPIIPLGPIVATNVVLFGPWGGLTVSYTGAMLGAASCFWAARLLGRDWLSRFVDERHLQHYEAIAQQHGFQLMLLGRYVPPVNSFISYLGGLSPVSFRTFMWASAVGLLPWIVVFTVFSSNLLAAKTYGVWISLTVAPLALIYIARRFRRSMSRLAVDTNAE